MNVDHRGTQGRFSQLAYGPDWNNGTVEYLIWSIGIMEYWNDGFERIRINKFFRF
jgi:hypothetical protein